MRARRRRQARPGELLDAALTVFVDKGFDAARPEEIAARAGVSKGTLYLYFRSKEDLLKSLIENRLFSRIAVADQLTADAAPSLDLLRDALRAWHSALTQADAGAIFKLVLAETGRFPELAQLWLRDVIEPARRQISAIVARGIARGEFRPVNPDVVMHSLVLSTVTACLHRRMIPASALDDPLMKTPDLFGQHLGLVLEGLTSR